MGEFTSQLTVIATAVLLVVAIIVVVSGIIYFIENLTTKDLSDQVGWRNFKNPIIGISFIASVLLSIVLVVLVLLGAL